jgi:DNA-binding response OmpR family regulator
MPAKILIVDDSELVLAWVRMTLEPEGYVVITQAQALGVGAVMIRERPDLMLIDIMMPTLSGDELVQLVRNNGALKDTIVVLHSSKTAAELKPIAKRCGADGYLEKTTEPKELVHAVKGYLARRSRLKGEEVASAPPGPPPQFVQSSWVQEDSPKTQEIKRRNGNLPRPLFIDDDERILTSYKRLFGAHMDAEFVSSVADAIARLESDDPPDVVICDVMMPEQNGVDLYRLAQGINPSWRHRFIFVSGQAYDEPADSLLSTVDAPVLNKPVNPRVLSGLIRGLRSIDGNG